VASTAATLAERYGGIVRRTFAGVRGFAVRMPAEQARRLAADRGVAYVEQDRRFAAAEPSAAEHVWLDTTPIM
jgi:hypothetical protein